MTNREKDDPSVRKVENEEETFFARDRKQGKIERKRIRSKDRSKFKKTDSDKYSKSVEEDLANKFGDRTLPEGRVLSILPQGILVAGKEGIFRCLLKGLLKKEKTSAKNLVAVGDEVLFEKIGKNEGIVVRVKPRRTFLSRADNLSRRKEQLIAVNIDNVMITVSVCNPPLKFAIVDRYIIAARKGGMQPVVVVNKIDLLEAKDSSRSTDDERSLLKEAIGAYAEAGVLLIPVSTVTGYGMDSLKRAMRDKASVFSGPSGTGKSSLINALTGSDLRTGDVVEKTKKGSHTTTTASLIPLECGGWCIDTPGVKSFGVWKLSIDEVQSYFPEIERIGAECKYADCTHMHEEDCAVRIALEKGTLSPSRFDSYGTLLSGIKEEHIRR